MPFNLLADRAFPVVMRSGARRWLTFAGISACHDTADDDYAVEFDWPRTDLDMASYELCVGICHLAFDIRGDDDWRTLWRAPPGQKAVSERLAPFAHAFDLDGDGPRFLQDLEPLEADIKDADVNPVEALLIDTPGQNGQKKNADLLTHRDRYPALGLPAAAMALYALQAYAPSGGAGNRTSMRGGGPLSALVIPVAVKGAPPVSLWRKVLANVGHAERLKRADLARALPWLAPTLTSGKEDGGRTVNPDKDGAAHPLQAFFGMPRRIRLIFGDGRCAMTGATGPIVTGFAQKPWGVNYGVWMHPMTPYRRQKEAEPPYSVKPKSGRFGYRDWVSVTLGTQDGLLAEMPLAVALARRKRSHALAADGADPRIRVGGWAMSNMEAVVYLFAEQPLHLARTKAQGAALEVMAHRFADAADLTASALRGAIRQAVFGQATVSLDSGALRQARTAFFEETEAAFHDLLDTLLVAVDEGGHVAKPYALERRWLARMRRTALAVFDRLAPVPVDDVEKAEPVVAAYGRLSGMLTGYGKDGEKLFSALRLPLPEKRAMTTVTEEAT